MPQSLSLGVSEECLYLRIDPAQGQGPAGLRRPTVLPTQPDQLRPVGRIDSHKGGIRTSFETAPDAPVSEFVLNMQGGKRGLIVNSRNICARVNRARTSFTGHNAKQATLRPALRNSRCSKKARKRSRRHLR